MPTAEELLYSNRASESSVLTIDLETRTVNIPSAVKNLGVESDDDVKTLYFSVPRRYDKFDLFDFDIYINYRNARKNPDRYTVTDATIDGDNLVFSWLVGRFATQFKGEVPFVVCFKKYASDGVTVEQELNTTPTTIEVLEGLETSEAVVQAYPDVLTSWEQDLFGYRDNGVHSIEEATEAALATVHSEVEAIVAGNEAYTKHESDTRYGIPIVGEIRGDDELLIASDSAEMAFHGLRIFGKSTQAVTTGKNLYNCRDVYSNRTGVIDEGDYITLSGDNTSGTGELFLNHWTNPSDLIESNGVYKIVLEVKSLSNCTLYPASHHEDEYPQFINGWGDITRTGIFTTTVTAYDFTTTTPTWMLRTYTKIDAGYSGYVTFRIMVMKENETDTTYEPYSGGFTSPSMDWAQEINNLESPSFKLYGANLANLQNLTVNSNTSVNVSHDGYRIVAVGGGSKAYASSTTYLNAALLRGKDIVLKADSITSYISSAKAVVQLNIFTSNNKYYEPISTDSLSRVLSIPEDTYELTLGVYTNNNAAGLGSDNTVIAEGIGIYMTDREWVPCDETQELSLSYTVPGVPVSSGGNYTDSNGQQYICDEIDFGRGVYIQRVGHLDNILIDSTGQNEFTESVTTGYKKYTVRRNLRGMAANADNVAMGLCNRFTVNPISGNITNNTSNLNTCIAWSRTSGGFYIMVPETEFPDLESLVDSLTLNPVEVYYVLETPVETELGAEVMSAYGALHSNKPVTMVFNEGTKFTMEAEYVVDTKTYIDNKFAEIEAKLG